MSQNSVFFFYFFVKKCITESHQSWYIFYLWDLLSEMCKIWTSKAQFLGHFGPQRKILNFCHSLKILILVLHQFCFTCSLQALFNNVYGIWASEAQFWWTFWAPKSVKMQVFGHFVSFHWVHISFSSHANCKYFLMCVESMTQRQNFSELLCTCFEICNWNLAYSSGRWYNTSSWSIIAMRLIWPTLQPGNFWPCGLKHSEGGNHWSDRLGSLPLASFPKNISKGLRYQLESWWIYSVGCTTYWVHVSRAWGPCDLLHVLGLGTVN